MSCAGGVRSSATVAVKLVAGDCGTVPPIVGDQAVTVGASMSTGIGSPESTTSSMPAKNVDEGL